MLQQRFALIVCFRLPIVGSHTQSVPSQTGIKTFHLFLGFRGHCLYSAASHTPINLNFKTSHSNE